MSPSAPSTRRSTKPRFFANRGNRPKQEPKILFQQFFKSVGPRTYAAQVKQAGNGNHFLVLTEGKRDDKNGEVRKTRLFVYSEDFVSFFHLLKQSAEFIKANPMDPMVKAKRDKFWAGKTVEQQPLAPAAAGAEAAA